MQTLLCRCLCLFFSAVQSFVQASLAGRDPEEAARLRQVEDELRDPKNFLECADRPALTVSPD